MDIKKELDGFNESIIDYKVEDKPNGESSKKWYNALIQLQLDMCSYNIKLIKQEDDLVDNYDSAREEREEAFDRLEAREENGNGID